MASSNTGIANEVIELSDIIVVTHNDKNLEIIKNINIQNKPIINPWGLNI
jgi:hypothetical protein